MARQPFDLSKLDRRWGARDEEQARSRQQQPKQDHTVAPRLDIPIAPRHLSTGASPALGDHGSVQFRVYRRQHSEESRSTPWSAADVAGFDNELHESPLEVGPAVVDLAALASTLVSRLERQCLSPAMLRGLGKPARRDAMFGFMTMVRHEMDAEIEAFSNRQLGQGEPVADAEGDVKLAELFDDLETLLEVYLFGPR